MYNAAACKVHVAHIEDTAQPAAPPGPGHNHGVDEGGHAKGIGGIGGALHTLRHPSAHDGRPCRAKGPLKEPAQHGALAAVGAAGHRGDNSCGSILRVEVQAEEAAGANEAVCLSLCPVGEGPTEAPPAQGADANVHQILHEDVGCIFGTATAGLQHRKAGVHKHDQGSAKTKPCRVNGAGEAVVCGLQACNHIVVVGLVHRDLQASGVVHVFFEGRLAYVLLMVPFQAGSKIGDQEKKHPARGKINRNKQESIFVPMSPSGPGWFAAAPPRPAAAWSAPA